MRLTFARLNLLLRFRNALFQVSIFAISAASGKWVYMKMKGREEGRGRLFDESKKGEKRASESATINSPLLYSILSLQCSHRLSLSSLHTISPYPRVVASFHCPILPLRLCPLSILSSLPPSPLSLLCMVCRPDSMDVPFSPSSLLSLYPLSLSPFDLLSLLPPSSFSLPVLRIYSSSSSSFLLSRFSFSSLSPSPHSSLSPSNLFPSSLLTQFFPSVVPIHSFSIQFPLPEP